MLDHAVVPSVRPDDVFEIVAPEPPTVDPVDHRDVLRRRRRWVVMAVFGAIAGLVVHELFGVMVADQRQRHLAHEVTIADERVTPGEAAMVLQAPDIDLNVVVAEGASSAELRGGPGRVIGTARPEGAGNVVVLGRRSRFGAAFARLHELVPGASIVVRSRAGLVREYTVERVDTISTSSTRPLRSSEDRLTLVTSGSGFLPSTRLVVVARALAPPGGAPTAGGDGSIEPPVIGLGALDERSSGVMGLALATVLLAACVGSMVLGVRRLAVTYRRSTVIGVVLPMAALLLIVVFLIGDSALPTTY